MGTTDTLLRSGVEWPSLNDQNTISPQRCHKQNLWTLIYGQSERRDPGSLEKMTAVSLLPENSLVSLPFLLPHGKAHMPPVAPDPGLTRWNDRELG